MLLIAWSYCVIIHVGSFSLGIFQLFACGMKIERKYNIEVDVL